MQFYDGLPLPNIVYVSLQTHLLSIVCYDLSLSISIMHILLFSLNICFVTPSIMNMTFSIFFVYKINGNKLK